MPQRRPAPAAAASPTDTLEATLLRLLGPTPPPPQPRRGRPPVVPAAVLWTGLLLCLLRGFQSQRDLWRLLCHHGWGHQPRYDVTEMAIYARLQEAPATTLAPLLAQVTAAVQAEWGPLSDCPAGAFAREIYAVDHTILDPICRRRQLLRELPPGDRCLLPGALGCVFDVRRQLWVHLRYLADPQQDLHHELAPLLTGLPPGSLLLFDLGYFAFWQFDALTEGGYHYVTRWRARTTWQEAHVFYAGGSAQVHLWDGLVYPGKHRADQAAHPVRLIQLTVQRGQQRVTYRYLTNVLDPRVLPAWEVVALYRRRWDVEQAFDLVKTHLGLALLWSSHPNVLLHQVYAVFILCQVLLALRNEIATRAGCDLREVSLELLVRWLPRLAADGHDPVAEVVRTGWRAGYLRPFRGAVWEVPHVPPEAYGWPPQPLGAREPRYGSRDYAQRTYQPDAEKAERRARYWADATDHDL